MAATVDLVREQAVYAGLKEKGQDRPDITVAVGVPDVNAGGGEFLGDSLVTRDNNVLEEVRRDDWAVLETNVLLAVGKVEINMTKHLIKIIFHQGTHGLNHVLDHLRIVVASVGQALKG